MSSLQDAYDRGGRWQAVARAALLLAGSLIATVGFVSTTASLVAGFGVGKPTALALAALFGATLLLAGFLGLFARTARADRSRSLAAGGTALAVAGLVLFWTTVPSGWSGRVAELPPVALGAYAVGLLAVFGAGFTFEGSDPAGSADAESGSRSVDSGTGSADAGSLGGVEAVVTADPDDEDARAVSPAVGDGGEDDDDLRFFDDEGT